MKDTGLVDNYGTPIMEGDTIEWTYQALGIMIPKDDGTENFLPCIGGGSLIKKELKETKTIQYEVRDCMAGYFLDRPYSISSPFITEEPKCKVIKL